VTWEQREEILDAMRKVMVGLPARTCYYPGAAERQKEAVAFRPARLTEKNSKVRFF